MSLAGFVHKFYELYQQQHEHEEHYLHPIAEDTHAHYQSQQTVTTGAGAGAFPGLPSNHTATQSAQSSILHRSRTLIELHLHLDGSIRTATILDVAKQRGMSLPASTVEELEKHVTVPFDCQSLTAFLSTFRVFIPVIKGSASAIERIAYELCEDEAKHGVCYFEARYAPHLLADSTLSPAQVVEAVNRGLSRGMQDFTVYAKSILCCMRHMPDMSMEVVELANKYRGDGVVGIDLAGDEALFPAGPHAAAFRKAKEYGLHRTVHAGEAGPAHNVTEALDILSAERIGHGYHIVQDKAVYDRVKSEDIHLECCLSSSLQTGSVKSANSHPIRRFSRDKLNFSLSTDDAGVCRTDIHQEHIRALWSFNLDPSALSQATFNAARSSFLPEHEKKVLLQYLQKLYFPSKVMGLAHD